MEDNTDQLLDETADENSELFEHVRIVVDKGQTLLRIDKFLQNRLENTSRNRIQQAAKAGNILVNNQVVKSNYKVKPEDVIAIVFSYPPKDIDIFPEDIPLDVVYEDDAVIVINKQANLVVHPGYNNYSGTLLHALAYHFEKSRFQKPENGFGYLVHRIDKDTSGLLLIARDELSQSRLAKQFFDHSIERRYHAIAWGNPNPAEGTIKGHIGRSYKDRRVMAVFPDGEYGKEAITHYKTLESFGYVSLIECKLETGRTHQIRAHFRHIGHPLFNDAMYGGNVILKGTTFSKYRQFVDNCFKILPRQALHAKTLGFVHPVTGIFIRFDSKLPADMQDLLDKWSNYTKNRDDFS